MNDDEVLACVVSGEHGGSVWNVCKSEGGRVYGARVAGGATLTTEVRYRHLVVHTVDGGALRIPAAVVLELLGRTEELA